MKSANWSHVLRLVTLLVAAVLTGAPQDAAAQEFEVPSPWGPPAFPGPVSHRRASSVTMGFVPKHEQWAASHGWRKAEPSLIDGESEVGPGNVVYGEPPRTYTAGQDDPSVWDGLAVWDDPCAEDFCEAKLRTWQVLGGVQGFTGPINRGGEGSFGFYEGLSVGSPLPLGIPTEIGWQAGFRLTQSNLSGTSFTDEVRHQLFITSGIFHRVDRGLQWALAGDWLHEDWYFEADLTQLRGEVSWKGECEREFGVAFATGTRATTAVVAFQPATVAPFTEAFETTDWYAGFFRLRFGSCQENVVRFLAGFTGESDGLLGADALLQINESWAVQSTFTFLIPQESRGFEQNGGHEQESWNIAFGLVWTPGCRTVERGYYTPVLNVADNGSFFVERP
ncbi:MAG: DUF6666 family protein [Pirellulales bacterium]